MALTVETGAGLVNADSYASVAEATAYFAARARADDWDLIDDKDAALRAATEYLQSVYGTRWDGMRTFSAQALDWPRIGVPRLDDASGEWASNAVPLAVKRACMELAIRWSPTTPLLTDLGRETLSERVDVIAVTYAQGASRQTQYAAVAAMLRPFLRGGSGGNYIEAERA